MSKKQIKFVCPECGNTTLDELLEASFYYRVVSAEKSNYDTVSLDYEREELVYAEEPECYCCGKCDFEIAYSAESLYKWLDERDMLESDEESK